MKRNPNIRSNREINGYFYSNKNYKFVGKLSIKNGKIILYLIGNNSLINNKGQLINSSNDGYIYGNLANSEKFICKNFTLNSFKIHFKGISSTSYELFSFTEYNESNISPNYRNYGKVILNIDKLSNYLYLPQVFNDQNPGYIIGDIQYKKHIYTISLNFNSYPERNTEKLRDINQRWINFAIQAHFTNWDNYKYILPLAKDITKFIKLMTRLRVNVTNIEKFMHHSISYFIGESKSYKLKYFPMFHHLSYLYNVNNFRHILNNFLNRDNHLNALTSSFLSIISTNNSPIQSNLMSLTNAIQIYYSNAETTTGHSLRNKLEFLVNSLPKNISSLILQGLPIKNFVYNIKDTRNHIVHGDNEHNKYGKVLTGINFPLQTNMLKWLVYSKILLDIGVFQENVYEELSLCSRDNRKKNYIKYNY